VSPGEKRKVLVDYFHEFIVLETELRLAETDEEIKHIEIEVNRIRTEIRDKFKTNYEGDFK